MVKPPYWEPPALWEGATVVIIGGGPSLTPWQVEACRDRPGTRVIAVNNAYQLAPWADMLYFCDDKWWGWHAKHLADWRGMIVRLQGGQHDFGDPRIRVIRNLDQAAGLSLDRRGVHHGKNSGYQAINLSVHLGVKKIVLLGFDQKGVVEGRRERTHWHPDHPGGTSSVVYYEMRPHFDTLVRPLAQLGVEIVNCTPGSAINCFRRGDIHEEMALQGLPCAAVHACAQADAGMPGALCRVHCA